MIKNWHYFLACLALSASIWLIHNLSHMQTDVITVQVIAESGIPGRAARSSDAVSMTARCKTSGFRLLYLKHKDTPVTVRFDAEDLTQEDADFFSISASQLYRYVNDIFGAGASVESFLFDKVRFRFVRELNKKVPVEVASVLGFRSQYMQNGDFVVQPDSVLVYGPAELLARTDVVKTRRIERSDIHSNLHGEVLLEVPEGLRVSSNSVSWALEVSRFVEIVSELQVYGRNVPAGTGFSVYPDKVKVVFRCAFPVLADPSEQASCYVDYREFSQSRTGRCVIHCDNLPKGVIDFTVQPAVAECVEQI